MREKRLIAVMSSEPPKEFKKLNKKNFDIIKIIGKGGFSNVFEGIFNIAIYSET